MNTDAAAQAGYRRFLERRSFIEMNARERVRAVLDPGTYREMLGPFDRIKSPWLPLQGIVAQADDGVVLARGTLQGKPALIAAIESAYQGGSMGEVSGAKIAGALELALEDCEQGRAPARGQLGTRGHCGNSRRHHCAAPLRSGRRRHCRHGGLFRRNVTGSGAVHAPHCHASGAPRHEWPGGH
jgi:hypothetical protein